MKAKNGQVDEELMAIKQFRNNYARDLINKLIKEGEYDAWFSLIREDINELELKFTHSHNIGIKDRLIDMLEKSMHNLQTKDYEDTDSTTHQKLTELAEMVKSQDKLEPQKYSKLHRSLLEFMSIL